MVDGLEVGDVVGETVGLVVGLVVGEFEGTFDGAVVGSDVVGDNEGIGDFVGELVGAHVCSQHVVPHCPMMIFPMIAARFGSMIFPSQHLSATFVQDVVSLGGLEQSKPSTTGISEAIIPVATMTRRNMHVDNFLVLFLGFSE